jgi:predicted Zn-dependent protease
MIESSWLRAIEIGEQPGLQDSVRGRGSFLAAHNLAVLHASLGADAAAAHWREREAALRAAPRSPRPSPERREQLRRRRIGGRTASFPAFAARTAAYPCFTTLPVRRSRRAGPAHHGPRPSRSRTSRRFARPPSRPSPLAGGQALAEREQWPLAAREFEQASGLHGDHAYALAAVHALIKADRAAEAAERARSVREADPSVALAYLLESHALLGLGRAATAVDTLRSMPAALPRDHDHRRPRRRPAAQQAPRGGDRRVLRGAGAEDGRLALALSASACRSRTWA